MSWRIGTSVSEAGRNLSTAAVRTALSTVVAAGLVGALTFAEHSTTTRLIDFRRDFEAQGGFVAVVFNENGLPAERCERLPELIGAEAAGGFNYGSTLATGNAPGSLFSMLSVTEGIFDVWVPDDHLREADIQVAIGSAVAEELGVQKGRFLLLGEGEPRAITAVVDTEDRNPQAMRSILSVVPPIDDVNQCWVAFGPGAHEAGIASLRALFSDTGPDTTVGPYRRTDEFTLDPVAELASRPMRNGWLAVGLAIALLAWVGWWARRAEFGLYRAIGTARNELLLMAWVESFVTTTVGALLGFVWATAVFDATHGGELSGGQILLASRNAVAAALLAIALGPLAAVLMGRTDVASQLKDR